MAFASSRFGSASDFAALVSNVASLAVLAVAGVAVSAILAKQFGVDVDDWHPSGGGGLKDELKAKVFDGVEGTKLEKLYGKNPDFGLGGNGEILIKPTDLLNPKKGKMFDTGLNISDFPKPK